MIYAGLLGVGLAVAVAWAAADSGRDGLVHAASVAASGFATYAVGWLAIAALVNSLAGAFQSRYLWLLPSHVRYRPDLWVGVAVVVGIVGGYMVWQ